MEHYTVQKVKSTLPPRRPNAGQIMPFNIEYTTLHSLHSVLFGTFPHLPIENDIPARIMP